MPRAARYTVPQRISRNAGEVRVYFRVGRIMNNATITLRVGDRVLLQKKKRKMAPGEMECLVLPAEVVAALDDAAELCAEEVEA